MRKYKGEIIPERYEPLRKVSKIHFLIHPGFLDIFETSKGKLSQEKVNELLNQYIKKAEKLGQNELMFIFLYGGIGAVFTDKLMGARYLQVVKRIRGILKDRAIVVTDTFGVLSPKSDMGKLKACAKARGYDFDEQVLSEAYGETLDWCVQEGAANLNRKLGLKSNTKIISDLTDASTWGGLTEKQKGNKRQLFEKDNLPLEIK